MVQQNWQTMKKLTKMKLVNWHYFSNETIPVNGSFLISGENASGKSTILDAIQLVLTTNTRRFNPAANEKSKRDLKGYVRCKTGEEGNTYYRTGSVISYIALEFYEESKDKYFVIGVKLDSPDLESEVKKKWFCEEGTLDTFSFIVNNKPALDEQFRHNGQKVTFIQQDTEAKNRFKRRLGNLEDNFFKMLPKSLAFKPMDNVKSFINKFILPERRIEIDTLRANIRYLRELQELIAEVRKQIAQLEEILHKEEEIKETDENILIIDILIKIAELEAKKDYLEELEQKCKVCQQSLHSKQNEEKLVAEQLKIEEERLNEINVAIRTNECSQLITKLENDLNVYEEKKKPIETALNQLNIQIGYLMDATKHITDLPKDITASGIRSLSEPDRPQAEKDEMIIKVRTIVETAQDNFYTENAQLRQKKNMLQEKIGKLRSEIEELKQNRLIYPENTIRLQTAIIKEFQSRSIDSEVRIFADLLEIAKPEWQDAIEGYLNTQRFNLIVEPRYYDIAASVYDKLKSQIHSVALVNVQALDMDSIVSEDSLATAVKSDSRYATAYANYLLGRVVCCDNVQELKQHKVAITQGCMLYQSNALRKIDEKIYRIPYIGKSALKRQLELKETEWNDLTKEKQETERRIKENDTVIEVIKKCNFEVMQAALSAPSDSKELQAKIRETTLELKEARNNPNIIELQIKLEELRRQVNVLKSTETTLRKSVINLERDIEEYSNNIKFIKETRENIEKDIFTMSAGNEALITLAKQKYEEHKRKKTAEAIYENYQPRRKTLENQRNKKFGELTSLQTKYKGGEFGTGEEVIPAYVEEYTMLSKHDLIRYEEKLEKAKNDCELEFRENFLAKMRENIELAKETFKDLNKALKSIYYGNDSYRFHLSAHPLKQGLYEMITSEVNLGGFTLFSNAFEDKYRTEMDTLFLKLTESDDTGDAILTEYTDYRGYLDYDIEIISKDGKSQYFSKIYGEKSGGETQTPYYVAIAASFSQMYSFGESIRIIMLDEAFDKMDDDRIAGMMQFFRSQNFQIILATPPSKMEVIGEYVDTILLAYRDGYSSTVEEYTYEEL